MIKVAITSIGSGVRQSVVYPVEIRIFHFEALTVYRTVQSDRIWGRTAYFLQKSPFGRGDPYSRRKSKT